MTRLSPLLFACLLSCPLSRGADPLAGGLPLPDVPDSLCLPQERAEFVLAHFWDAMDFSSRKYALDDVFMERAFADYAQVLGLPCVPDSVAQASVDSLFSRASVSPDAVAFLRDLAYTYLYLPESPVFNEEAFYFFVVNALADPSLSPAVRTRYDYLLSSLSLNPTGSPAPDFDLWVRPKGTGASCSSQATLSLPLSSFFSPGASTLVVFYDPDCHDCHRAISILASEPAVAAAVDGGRLRIVAVASADASDQWRDSPLSLPDGWVDACDATGVQDADLYVTRLTPTFVLISPAGRISLKNVPLGRILSAISAL